MPRVLFDKRARPPREVLSSEFSADSSYAPAIRRWIEEIAYDIWERRGRHPGDDLWNWLTAERFILAQLRTLGT